MPSKVQGQYVSSSQGCTCRASFIKLIIHIASWEMALFLVSHKSYWSVWTLKSISCMQNCKKKVALVLLICLFSPDTEVCLQVMDQMIEQKVGGQTLEAPSISYGATNLYMRGPLEEMTRGNLSKVQYLAIPLYNAHRSCCLKVN